MLSVLPEKGGTFFCTVGCTSAVSEIFFAETGFGKKKKNVPRKQGLRYCTVID